MFLERSKITDKVLCAEYEAVYSYIISLCKSEIQAQDITQETFVKAMKNYESFKGNSSLYTWLCTIAKNLWLNNCKKSNKEVMPNDFEKIACEKDFENTVSDKDISIHIHKALHTLDEPYKEVFTLRTFGELSFKDIANLFSKTES